MEPTQQSQKMQQTALILFSVSILIGIGFLLGVQYQSYRLGVVGEANSDVEIVDENLLQNIATVREEDAVYGNRAASVTVIEYSDFECPFCERFHPTVKRAVDESGGTVAWVYRHLPLSFHPGAKDGSIISECVKDTKGNDVFWEYTERIFDGTEDSVNSYRTIAENFGVTASQLDLCLADDSTQRKLVEKHIYEAESIQINGTPGGFVVNNKTRAIAPISGAIPFELLVSSIESVK